MNGSFYAGDIIKCILPDDAGGFTLNKLYLVRSGKIVGTGNIVIDDDGNERYINCEFNKGRFIESNGPQGDPIHQRLVDARNSIYSLTQEVKELKEKFNDGVHLNISCSAVPKGSILLVECPDAESINMVSMMMDKWSKHNDVPILVHRKKFSVKAMQVDRFSEGDEVICIDSVGSINLSSSKTYAVQSASPHHIDIVDDSGNMGCYLSCRFQKNPQPESHSKRPEPDGAKAADHAMDSLRYAVASYSLKDNGVTFAKLASEGVEWKAPTFDKACECGKEQHGFASHSDWCPGK